MMPATAEPHRYTIVSLLSGAVQPFRAMPDDELEDLGRAIGKGRLADPVSITADGILIDGSQRLKAMRRRGRKFIDAGDVRIIEDATRENALDWAVRLNASRRQLTVEEKAELARRLQRENKWSQGRIAKAFGVSRPAVTQWLGKARELTTGEAPAVIQGADGKFYDREAVTGRPSGRAPKPMWRPGGPAYSAVRAAVRKLQSEPYGGLGTLDAARLGQLLDDLIEAAEAMRDQVAGHPAVELPEPDTGQEDDGQGEPEEQR